jgi:hypothetical protein
MSETGLCWLSYDEQMTLREFLHLRPLVVHPQPPMLELPDIHRMINEIRTSIYEELSARVKELTRDNETLRAEIETLQRMRHIEMLQRMRHAEYEIKKEIW